jgi:diaminopimelate epimerase
MNKIKFSKLNGQGNDFIIIDSSKSEIKLPSKLISFMCDRHFGIGADGLIIVRNSKVADFMMDFYNHDGSRAEMCGNGIRCMARFIHDKKLQKNKLLKNSRIRIETMSGVKNVSLELIKNKKKTKIKNLDKTSSSEKIIENYPVMNIKVDMGLPQFNKEKIPVNLNNNHELNEKKLNNGFLMNYKLKINSLYFNINCVSMGNPHCVIFLDDNIDINTIPLSDWGPKIENNHIFPKKTNVEFIKIKNNTELTMRVWERGVGETLACGTGACASAICAIKLEKIKSTKVKVNLPGGKLNIYWKNEKSPVYLEGEVNYIYDGEYFLN